MMVLFLLRVADLIRLWHGPWGERTRTSAKSSHGDRKCKFGPDLVALLMMPRITHHTRVGTVRNDHSPSIVRH